MCRDNIKKGVSELKGNTSLLVLFFILLLIVPCVSLISHPQPSQQRSASSAPATSHSQASSTKSSAPTSKAAVSKTNAPAAKSSGKTFHILDKTSGNVLTVDELDFLRSTVATEISPDSPPEALKAQAVAAYTYYTRLKQQNRQKPDASLKGADFSCETGKWNIYATNDQMKSRWKEDYNKFYGNLTSTVDTVYGKVLCSGGKLIDATYYAISSGKTENAADVWGSASPCLVPVASPADIYAPGYLSTVQMSATQFQSAANSLGCKLNGSPDSWIGTAQRTPSGMVSTLQIGGKSVKGTDIRKAFDLRSSDFTIACTSNSLTFTVKGYGHGVGMSQAGAIAMAQQGESYANILAWYYPGSTLSSL
jgi:stage II sporulation protein D